jgi:hypothetical protein
VQVHAKYVISSSWSGMDEYPFRVTMAMTDGTYRDYVDEKSPKNVDLAKRLEMTTRLAQGCSKHKAYRAKRKPTAHCTECQELYQLAQNLRWDMDTPPRREQV